MLEQASYNAKPRVGENMTVKPLLIRASEDFSLTKISAQELIARQAIIIEGFSLERPNSNSEIYTREARREGTQTPHQDEMNGRFFALYSPRNCTVLNTEPFTFFGNKEQVVQGLKEYFYQKALQKTRQGFTTRISNAMRNTPRFSKGDRLKFPVLERFFQMTKRYGI